MLFHRTTFQFVWFAPRKLHDVFKQNSAEPVDLPNEFFAAVSLPPSFGTVFQGIPYCTHSSFFFP